MTKMTNTDTHGGAEVIKERVHMRELLLCICVSGQLYMWVTVDKSTQAGSSREEERAGEKCAIMNNDSRMTKVESRS